MKFASTTVLVSAGLLALCPLSAATIPLINGSFEDQTVNQYAGTLITGWSKTNANNAGQWFGTVSNVNAGFTSGLSGNNAMWLNGTLTQLTSATFVQGVTYTLTFDVGNPSDVGATTAGLTVGFRNQTNVASGDFRGAGNGNDGSRFVGTNTINAITGGTFQSFTVSYTATLADAGQAIRIGATDYFSGGTIGTYRLDNFQLSDNTVAIPESSSYAIIVSLAGLGFAASRRRRRA